MTTQQKAYLTPKSWRKVKEAERESCLRQVGGMRTLLDSPKPPPASHYNLNMFLFHVPQHTHNHTTVHITQPHTNTHNHIATHITTDTLVYPRSHRHNHTRIMHMYIQSHTYACSHTHAYMYNHIQSNMSTFVYLHS